MILEDSGEIICNVATHHQKKRRYSGKCLVRWQITESTYKKSRWLYHYQVVQSHKVVTVYRIMTDQNVVMLSLTVLLHFKTNLMKSIIIKLWIPVCICGCFHFYLEFFPSPQCPPNTIILLDIKTEGEVLERPVPIISGPLVLIAWWLYNHSNMMRWIIHQALWLPEEHHRQMGWVMSQAVETDPAQFWLLGIVNFISIMWAEQRVLWSRTGDLTEHPLA